MNRCDTGVDLSQMSLLHGLRPEIGARIGKDVLETDLSSRSWISNYRVYDGYKALYDKYPERIVRIWCKMMMR